MHPTAEMSCGLGVCSWGSVHGSQQQQQQPTNFPITHAPRYSFLAYCILHGTLCATHLGRRGTNLPRHRRNDTKFHGPMCLYRSTLQARDCSLIRSECRLNFLKKEYDSVLIFSYLEMKHARMLSFS
jgi:hypothetical protein